MKKIILCILDGIGLNNEQKGNAFYNASTPNIDKLLKNYPHSKLFASGTYVGLPKMQMGNSEVGHMTIGGGKTIFQSLEYINQKINNKEIDNDEKIIALINETKKRNSNLHLIGLLSDGGVHSHINHLFKILEICKDNNLNNVYIHVFTDGRDTLPNSGIKYIDMLNKKIKELGIGKIASLSGRYYSMDRDNRYERIKKYYDVIINGNPISNKDISDILKENYENNITDEFISPVLLDKDGIIKENDSVFIYNFRPDRLRELLTVLIDKNFNEFEIKKFNNLKILSMMPVNDKLNNEYVYSLDKIENPLGVYLDKLGKKQLRIAETEKYAHVTYFFDGGKEIELKNSKRILVPSPKVATYDMQPEMSAYEINKILFNELDENFYDLVVLNYANCDMVGHTGNYFKAVKAVETVDEVLGNLYDKYKDEYLFIITADHGNCEKMLNEDNSINTSHTNNKVFLIITDKSLKIDDGSLRDIAPTILDLYGIDKPSEMNGESLIKR